MALSGSEIIEILPRINCQECGYPRCRAFAEELAANHASPDLCRRLSEGAKKILSDEWKAASWISGE